MLEAKVKFLASLYTAILMVVIGSLLIFGDFNISPKMVKGTTIQATMIDISQLKPRKKSTTKKRPVKQQKIVKSGRSRTEISSGFDLRQPLLLAG